MRTKWTIIIILLLSTLFSVSAQTPSLPTDICGDDTVTPSEATILEEIKAISNTNPYILHSTSPTCTFVVAMFQNASNPGGERQFVAWSLYGGYRLFDYIRPRETNREVPIIHWNSQESEVLIGAWYDSGASGFDRATFPYHLWKLDGSSAVVMRCETSCVTPLFDDVTWDDGRNWLWTRGWSGAVAYDRNSGQVTRSFYNPPWDSGLTEPGGWA